jgi:hypothetical protein
VVGALARFVDSGGDVMHHDDISKVWMLATSAK